MSGDIVDLDKVSNRDVEVLDFSQRTAKFVEHARAEEPGGCGGCGSSARTTGAGKSWQSQWYDPPERLPQGMSAAEARPSTLTKANRHRGRTFVLAGAPNESSPASTCDGLARRLLEFAFFPPPTVLTGEVLGKTGLPAGKDLGALLRGGLPAGARIEPVEFFPDTTEPLPLERRDRGCGAYRMTFDEAYLLAVGYAQTQEVFPPPPLVYSTAFAERARVSSATGLEYIAARDRYWVDMFVVHLNPPWGVFEPNLAAAESLATAVLGVARARLYLTYESRIRAIGEWLFHDWTAAFVELDATSYGVHPLDVAGRIRSIGARYEYYDARPLPGAILPEFVDEPLDLLVPRACPARPEPPTPPEDPPRWDNPPELDPDDIRRLLDELRRAGHTGGPPPDPVTLVVRTDDRQWPYDYTRGSALPFPHFMPFDARDMATIAAVHRYAEERYPAPLHGMVDPRDGISWDQKWIESRVLDARRLHDGDPGWDDAEVRADARANPEGLILLQNYVAFTHRPGWNEATQAIVAALPADAVAYTAPRLWPAPNDLAGFVSAVGSANVEYRGWGSGGPRVVRLAIAGWFRDPIGTWWNCSDPISGAPCTEDEARPLTRIEDARGLAIAALLRAAALLEGFVAGTLSAAERAFVEMVWPDAFREGASTTRAGEVAATLRRMADWLGRATIRDAASVTPPPTGAGYEAALAEALAGRVYAYTHEAIDTIYLFRPFYNHTLEEMAVILAHEAAHGIPGDPIILDHDPILGGPLDPYLNAWSYTMLLILLRDLAVRSRLLGSVQCGVDPGLPGC